MSICFNFRSSPPTISRRITRRTRSTIPQITPEVNQRHERNTGNHKDRKKNIWSVSSISGAQFPYALDTAAGSTVNENKDECKHPKQYHSTRQGCFRRLGLDQWSLRLAGMWGSVQLGWRQRIAWSDIFRSALQLSQTYALAQNDQGPA